jgi:hypothetical protein
MWGDHNGEISPGNCRRERVGALNGDTLGIRKLHHMWINESDLCSLTTQEVHDVGSGRIPRIANIRLKRDTDDDDLAPVDGALRLVQQAPTKFKDVARHRKVDIGGKFDKAIDKVKLTSAP